MKKIQAIAQIKGSKLSIYEKDKFDQAIAVAKDGRFWLTLEKIHNKRSIYQNAFYWGPFLEVEMDILYNEGWHFANKDFLHEWNKSVFLKDKIVNEDSGEVIDIIKPSSGLTTVEWEEFIENIRDEFRDSYGVELPYPENKE